MSKNTNKNADKKPVNGKAATKGNPVGKASVTDKQSDGAVNRLSEKNLTVVITAAVLAVIILVSSVIFTVDWVKNDRGFDYLKSNLSRYVKLSESDYKNIYLEVDIAKPNDADVETAILNILASNKGDRLVDAGEFYTSGETVRPGSVVKIWYRGYLLDDNGEEIFVEGLSNYSSSVPTEFEIGSLYFPTGIEIGLNGYYLNKDRTRFAKIYNGQVTEDQVFYVNISKTITSSKTTSKSENVRIDLSGDVDAEYGVGFKEHLLSMSVDATKEFGITDAKGVHCTYKVEGKFATECEKSDDLLKIDGRFAYNAQIKTIRNEKVRFDIFVDSVQPYEYKELNEEFVKEIVDRKESKITMEKLNGYKGDTLVEKYREYIIEDLNKTYEDKYDQMVKEALWSYLHDKTTVKKYPASKVNEVYQEYINDIEVSFAQNGGVLWDNSKYQYVTHKTLDEYAVAYYGFTKSDEYPTWRDYVRGMAEMLVAERMIFYYIMDQDGYKPTDAEFEKCYNDTKTEYLAEYIERYLENDGKTKESFETEEEYNEYIKQRENEFFSYYDEEYFEETTYYNLYIDVILSRAEISTLDERSAYPQDK